MTTTSLQRVTGTAGAVAELTGDHYLGGRGVVYITVAVPVQLIMGYVHGCTCTPLVIKGLKSHKIPLNP